MQRRNWTVWTTVAGVVLLGLTVLPGFAQRAGERPRNGQGPANPGGGPKKGPNYTVPPKGELPADDRVLKLYMDFVQNAEKLAKEYEAAGKTEMARGVYLEILKIAPNFKPAKQKLEEYHEKEAKADKKTIDVMANKGWQETGIQTIAGKPLRFTATGTWTCKVTQEVGPDGLQISEELKGLNLGSLVGAIISNEKDKPGDKSGGDKKEEHKLTPFAIGKELEMVPTVTGRLVVRIYDLQTADNTGKLKLEVTGTFTRK